MYDPSLERLIEVSLADGVLTDKERDVICKKAASLGIDHDEIMVYVEGLLDEKKKSRPKSDKYGAKQTCPNCGAAVNPAAIKCEECGYLFNGVEASDVVKQFEDKVNQANAISRPGIIKRFPVPNTQEALFAMIEYLQPLCDEYGGATMNPMETGAYQAKFKECMARAAIAFPNHPHVLAYKELEKQRKGKRTKILVIAGLSLFAILFAMFGLGILVDNFKDSKSEAPEQATEEIMEDTSEIDESPDITEVPEGWMQMYIMSGRYEYCENSVINDEGVLEIGLYANGLSFSFTPDDSDDMNSVEFIIGKTTISATADEAGVVSTQVTDQPMVESIVKSLSNGTPIKIRYNGIESVFNLESESAQNIKRAIQWVKSLSNGFEI